MNSQSKTTFSDIAYVKLVTVGSINPNQTLSEEERQAQAELLNRCLSGHPRGMLIGTDESVAQYQIGGHMFTMKKVTYHVGFHRKPGWDTEKGDIHGNTDTLGG